MNSKNDEKGAAVTFPPPLIFLFVILASYGLHFFFWPIGIGNSLVLRILGVAIFALGIAIVLSADKSFKRAETNIKPWKPTTRILTTGLYSYSRNPIYSALCLAQIGIGLLANSLLVAVSFIFSAYLVFQIAIRKEEAYLESKFGKDYLDYKGKVRRWI